MRMLISRLVPPIHVPSIRIGRRLAVIALAGGLGCATLQQLVALRQVDFALGSVVGGRLAGVDLSRVRSAADLTATDLARVALAVARRDVPLEFTVNVEALNPADNKVTARMIRLQWVLLLQGKETVSGIVDQPITLAPGQPATIPLTMRLDLLQFFGEAAPDLVNIALAAAGANREATTISLRAVPTIDTPIGPITYPNPITIVSRTVGGLGR